MAFHAFFAQLMLVGVLLSCTVAIAVAAAQANPGCPGHCGNVSIPFPFGVDGCNLNHDFLITCSNTSSTPPTPYLRKSSIEVKNISIDGQLTIQNAIALDCYNHSGETKDSEPTWLTLAKFTISKSKNKFTVIGCDSYAYLLGKRDNKSYKAGCMSVCDQEDYVDYDSCSGSGCCQIEIPDGLYDIDVEAYSFNSHKNVSHYSPCTYAFIVENSMFKFSSEYLTMEPNKEFPIVLDWSINSTDVGACKDHATRYKPEYNLGYRCACDQGYEGNPYLGCLDTDECKDEHHNNCTDGCINTEGNYTCTCPKWYRGDGRRDGQGVGVSIIVSLFASSWLYLFLKRRRLAKLREKFFEQNGGLILKQKLAGREGSSDTVTIFTAEELKKATDGYNDGMIIGKGGFGTVYKGILTDNREVAIKKSTEVDQTQVEQFINEVTVLSQINHRNVVRLLGCCLETQVPSLVYEFIPNGNLFDFIEKQANLSGFPWEFRLKIAAETAGALSYLHSEASVTIIHRDVKTANILLDTNYTAKVSDFGASRFIPLNESQLSTMVQGTWGYLDPEYMHTSQLTEKSDVYSFGVVLMELLTGMKPLCFNRPQADRSLAQYFVSCLEKNSLFEILDEGIVNQGKNEQLKEVAVLAKQCVAVKGEERPTMKDVAKELEGMILMEKHPWEQVNSEETDYLLGEQSKTFGHSDGGNSISGNDSLRVHVVFSVGDGT